MHQKPYTEVGDEVTIRGKPYTVVSRVVMSRDADDWLPDVEAWLTEREISTQLAPAVTGLMNAFGMSLERATAQVLTLLDT